MKKEISEESVNSNSCKARPFKCHGLRLLIEAVNIVEKMVEE